MGAKATLADGSPLATSQASSSNSLAAMVAWRIRGDFFKVFGQPHAEVGRAASARLERYSYAGWCPPAALLVARSACLSTNPQEERLSGGEVGWPRDRSGSTWQNGKLFKPGGTQP
jgi:hypothetical protein